jgi:hypothetical protein
LLGIEKGITGREIFSRDSRAPAGHAIVRHEDDEGVFIQLPLLQLARQATDVLVDVFDHAIKSCLFLSLCSSVEIRSFTFTIEEIGIRKAVVVVIENPLFEVLKKSFLLDEMGFHSSTQQETLLKVTVINA